MDRSQWLMIQQLIGKAVKEVGPTPKAQYSDVLVLSMYVWAVSQDRPLSWACARSHYGACFRPRRLPSVSQFCRRVKTIRFQRFLQVMHGLLTNDVRLAGLNFLDGKALPVGHYSRDPDAKYGYGTGTLQRGYKLHALVTDERRIASWSVLPLNTHEMLAARVMVAKVPSVPRGAVVMADGNYDSHLLHKDISRRGAWLWCKPRGSAEHPVTLRQMGPARRALLQAWRSDPERCQQISRQRVAVEGTFSNLTSYGGGLGPLPSFVRRLDRVRRWVGTKIILYHVRLLQRKPSQN